MTQPRNARIRRPPPGDRPAARGDAQRAAGGTVPPGSPRQVPAWAAAGSAGHTATGADAGHELPAATRAAMESRLRRDFSQVRVHSGPAAAASAAEVGSRAYTSGAQIVFGHGEFQPDTRAGRSLIAHELAHVAAQDDGRHADPGTAVPDPPGSRAESEAHRAGTLASLGLPAGRIQERVTEPALTRTSAQVEPLISYSATDWAVTADEEPQVLTLLTADADLSATITDLHAAGMLRALLERR